MKTHQQVAGPSSLEPCQKHSSTIVCSLCALYTLVLRKENGKGGRSYEQNKKGKDGSGSASSSSGREKDKRRRKKKIEVEKEMISTRQEISLWLALAGFVILIVGIILSTYSGLISFTATSSSNADIESSNTYFLYGFIMVIVGAIMSKVGLSGLPNNKEKKEKV
jgi:hypothetical protein